MPIKDDQRAIMLRKIAQCASEEDCRVLSQALRARHDFLRSQRAISVRSRLEVGVQVQLSRDLKPRYLGGCIGEVMELDNTKVLINLGRPLGKFVGGKVWVPYSAVTVL